MKKILAALLLAGCANSLQADAIDDYVNAEMARERIPGVALAIVRHGELMRAQGFGFANIEHRVPVHPDTVFQSGSIGKQFTATAVMLLVEEGKLRLDESIRTYLPDSPRWWAPITLRHLLTHTSGLAGDPGLDMRADYTEEQFLKLIYKQPQDFPAGQRWSYSNTGYVVLGIVIGKVSGEFYADFLKKRVFEPLGMHTAQLIDDRGIVPNRASGYEVTPAAIRNQEWASPTVNSTADGSLYLTVLDYAKWDAGLLAGKILKPESWAQIATPVTLNSGKTYPYGFGWMLEKYAGQDVRKHSGSWQGFTTFIIRYLGDEITVIVLTNSDRGTPTRIARQVAGLYEPKLAAPAAAPIEESNPKVTADVRGLLERITAGKAERAEFANDPSKEEFAAAMTGAQQELQALGALLEIKLFEQTELGDDQYYRYRLRYEKGMREVNVGFNPEGKVASIELATVTAWDEPLSQ